MHHGRVIIDHRLEMRMHPIDPFLIRPQTFTGYVFLFRWEHQPRIVESGSNPGDEDTVIPVFNRFSTCTQYSSAYVFLQSALGEWFR